MSEPDLAGRLYILRLLDQYTIGIIQQGTFEKQKSTVIFKSMYQYYVAVPEGVTGTTPFQFFVQSAVKNDRSQFFIFFLPFCVFAEKPINFRIHFVQLLVN